MTWLNCAWPSDAMLTLASKFPAGCCAHEYVRDTSGNVNVVGLVATGFSKGAGWFGTQFPVCHAKKPRKTRVETMMAAIKTVLD